MVNEIKNNFPSQEQPNVKKGFRELQPEEFWGGFIPVQDISEEEFAQKISEAALELGFTYSGYRIAKEGGGFDYHFSRYPRRAFGPVPSIEKHQEALKRLVAKLGKEGIEEKLTEQPRFRVLLGLEEGYAEYKKNNIIEKINKKEIASLEQAKKALESEIGNLSEIGINFDNFNNLEELKNFLLKTDLGKKHTIEEVKRELGEGFDLTPAEIYSVGPWGKYVEPAVVIEGDESQLQKVYDLANKFHQARIAVEMLHKKQSYMVETKYCEDPDKE